MKFRHSVGSATKFLSIMALFLCGWRAFAQLDDQKEPVAIVEIGGAHGWSITGSGCRFLRVLPLLLMMSPIDIGTSSRLNDRMVC